MGDLRGLIAKVEAGTATAYDFGLMFPLATNFEHTRAWEAYLGSLDAAKALHEALLPDYGWGAGSWGARVWLYSDRPHWDGSNRQEVDMVNNPARAWLLAILRALEAEGKA